MKLFLFLLYVQKKKLIYMLTQTYRETYAVN
jgi:hypothetical protein